MPRRKTEPVVDPEPAQEETLVAVIRKISECMESLTRSGLNRAAVIVLLKEETRLGKREIGMVLDSLAELEDRYTK